MSIKLKAFWDMKKTFELTFELACYLWKRSDIGPMPKDLNDVAEVLRQAEIKVYDNRDEILFCEARPIGIREALTGEIRIPKEFDYKGYASEEPGRVLRILAEKGVPVTELEKHT